MLGLVFFSTRPTPREERLRNDSVCPVERETLTLDTKYAGSRKNRTIGRCETKTCNCASVLPRSSTRYFAKTIPTDFRNSFTDSAVDLHS